LIENCAVSQQVQVRYGLKATEITALPQTRWADSVEKVGPAQFFQRRGCGFQMQTRGASSSPSDSMERVLNRSTAVISFNEDADRILADLQ
jgi:hypothetical protein